MLFLKFMPWRSGFQGEFPVFRVPLNEEWCSLKFIIPLPAVQCLMQCWGPPAWDLGCSTPSIPVSCSWKSCFGANGFQPLMHHTAKAFPVPSLWSPSLSQQTLGNQAQVELHKPCSALVWPWPPAHLWMENKEVIDVLHVSLLLILLCKPPNTHLYLFDLTALLLRCTIVIFFHSWLLWIIFVFSWAFEFSPFSLCLNPFPLPLSHPFLVLWGMVLIF